MSKVLAALLMLQEFGLEVHKKTLLVSQKLLEYYQVNPRYFSLLQVSTYCVSCCFKEDDTDRLRWSW
jgi:hypothetical protein